MNVSPYAPDQERGASGTAFGDDIAGRPSFRAGEMALTCASNLAHRGTLGTGSDAGAEPPITGSEGTCPRG